MTPNLFEWLGTTLVLIGSGGLVWKQTMRWWIWIVYIGSNIFWLIAALLLGDSALTTVQVVFFIMNLIGLYRAKVVDIVFEKY